MNSQPEMHMLATDYDRQAKAFIDSGMHRVLGMSGLDLYNTIMRLPMLRPTGCEQAGLSIPVVCPPRSIDIESLCTLTAGGVLKSYDDLFSNMKDVFDTPDEWYVRWMQDGSKYLDDTKGVDDMLAAIDLQVERPVTLREGLAFMMTHPNFDALFSHHTFMVWGSQVDNVYGLTVERTTAQHGNRFALLPDSANFYAFNIGILTCNADIVTQI